MVFDPGPIFSKIAQLHIVIVGDIMLDTYWWGNVERISPEAPVPILSRTKTEYRIGGAGNVALNTRALGANTTIFSVTGSDASGDILCDMLAKENISINQIIRIADRPTTHKIRIMGRNQQMLRIDDEVTEDIPPDIENILLQQFQKFVEERRPDVVIFEDYNKGVLTQKTITGMMACCHANEVLTSVDPKRKNFFAYRQATIFKPNAKEVQEALHLTPEEMNAPDWRAIHRRLQQELAHTISLITLSEKGIFAEGKEEHTRIPAFSRDIADVSGAGDTVIAVASLVYAATRDIAVAAAIANIAGGLVCEEAGTVAVQKDKLMAECRKLL